MQTRPKSYNIGSIIAVVGLLVLVLGLILMLVLPEISYGIWVILGLGVALLAIALVLEFRRVRKAVTGRRGRFGLGTTVMAVIFIGITIFVNAISIGNYHRFDTSSLSQFTLTPQTIEVIKDLQEPIKITGFFVENDYYGIDSYVSSFLEEYKNHTDKITVEYIDPDIHPDEAKKYNISEYQTVVFECGDNKRLVPPSKYVVVDDEGNPAGIQAEHPFTSAILEVTGVAQKKVYFLTGHGEASIDTTYSKAAEGLRNDLYLVESLNLITNPEIPDDCAALIIAAPQTSLTDDEYILIQAYIFTGGQVMILTNPNSIPDIEYLITPWGVDIAEGTVVDPGSSVAPNQNVLLVTEQRNYFYLPSTYFPGAVAIIPQEEAPTGIEMMPLVYTTVNSWLDLDFVADQDPAFNSATEYRQSLAIGVLIAEDPTVTENTGKNLRLAVIGDSDFASNEHYNDANNSDLFLNTVSWLANETSLISIRRSVQPFRRLVVTEIQQNFIQYSSVALIPILVVITAGVIWWRRR